MTDSAQAAAARLRWPARFCQWLKRGWRRRLVSLAVFAAALLAVGAWQTRHVPDGMAPALAGTLPDGRALTLAQWCTSGPSGAPFAGWNRATYPA